MPEGQVALALAELRSALEVGFARIDGQLALLVQRSDQTDKAVEELEEDRDDSYELEIALWPGGERRFLLRSDFHGNWIRWRA